MAKNIFDRMGDDYVGKESEISDLEQRIVARLKSALPRPVIPRIQLFGRLVVLSGEVQTCFEKQLSQEAVRQTPGVGRVVSLLVVKGTPGTSEWVSRSMLLDLLSA